MIDRFEIVAKIRRSIKVRRRGEAQKDRISAFKDATWLSGNRAVRMNETTVAPGETATFEYWYKAPAQAKAYTEDFTVVVEGKSWVPYFGIRHNTTVAP